MLRYHGHFNRDQFLLGPLNESLLKARETLNLSSSVEQTKSWNICLECGKNLLILAFSLCLLHRGHNLDPDDSEVLFHLALNHALMRQVRINSNIIDCCVLWNGWFEQWGVSKEAWSMKLVRKNYRKKIVLSTQLSLYGWCSPIDVLLQCYFPHFNLFSGLYFEYLLVRYNICLCSYLLWVLGCHR